MLDSLLFSAARVWTFIDEQMLTSASGFFLKWVRAYSSSPVATY